jgi:hypothetical protein
MSSKKGISTNQVQRLLNCSMNTALIHAVQAASQYPVERLVTGRWR